VGQEFVALLAAVVSGGFALLSVIVSRLTAAHERTVAAGELALRYRTPLLHAAFDLQTRLYNIGKKDFLAWSYLGEGPEQQKEYAATNTLYLIAQYLCYSEIIRRGVLFLDPIDRKRQKSLMEAAGRVQQAFATTEIDDEALRLFRGEQRAIGETMLVESSMATPNSPRWDCMGYAEFVKRLPEPEVGRWFATLRHSIEVLASDPGGHRRRLVELQRFLLDLVALLDPQCEQVPSRLREAL